MNQGIILGNNFLTQRAYTMDFAEKQLDFNYQQKTYQTYGVCKMQTKWGLNNIILDKLEKIPQSICYRVSHK